MTFKKWGVLWKGHPWWNVWSLANGAHGKNVNVLDSTDVRAHRPKNASGHSAAPQTTDRKDLLAVAGSFPRGQTRIFIT